MLATLNKEVATEDISNDPKGQLYSGLILLGVIIAMILGDFPKGYGINTIEHGCSYWRNALRINWLLEQKQENTHPIDWVTIFLFRWYDAIVATLDNPGAGKMITNAVIGVMGS